MTDLQPLKRRCIGDLAAALPRYRQRLDDITEGGENQGGGNGGGNQGGELEG